jgi:hypothetical protein
MLKWAPPTWSLPAQELHARQQRVVRQSTRLERAASLASIGTFALLLVGIVAAADGRPRGPRALLAVLKDGLQRWRRARRDWRASQATAVSPVASASVGSGPVGSAPVAIPVMSAIPGIPAPASASVISASVDNHFDRADRLRRVDSGEWITGDGRW